jgi:hypothetical protein
VFKDKYQGKSIRWAGVVYSLSEKPIGTGFMVLVRMNPTESALGTYDLDLSVPEELKDEVLPLNKGDRVFFEGTISRQGGAIIAHEIQLSHIEPARYNSKAGKAGAGQKMQRRRPKG